MLKERYYTPETIEETSRGFITALPTKSTRRDYSHSLQRSALLVLDMQDYFLDENSHAFVPSALAIVPGIQTLVETFSAHQRKVVFTRHLNTPRNAGQMRRWWSEIIQSDSPLSRISTALDTSRGKIIEKSQYDAFYETPLQEFLLDNAVTQIVICGVMTHLCCETTARSAFIRGFEVYFAVDGTATYNRSYHLASLTNLAHGFATPLLVRDILQAASEHAA
ncbi:MAG TPA: isochorismatase family protein [Anaerolineales bacterium]|nr:isochorismatase family protein [Anaerolineales bacterium]